MAEYQSTFRGAEIDDGIAKARATQQLITYCESSTTATRNYAIGDHVIVGNVLYEVTAAIASGETISSSNASQVTVFQELDKKANKDGTIANSENADQLNSTVRVTDNAPYGFRTAGGGNDIGNRAYIDKIVGGTIAWNQLERVPDTNKSKTENGVTFTDNRDGTFTVSTDGTGAIDNTFIVADRVPIIQGHKYVFRSTPSGGSSETYYSYVFQRDRISSPHDVGIGCVANGTGSGDANAVLYIKSGTIITTPIIFKPNLFDLTQMFGTAIADYVYALETATPGAGVAWFRSMFPAPYYAYDVGTLRSVNVSAHKEIGFNQWDEEWEVGNINSEGIPTTASNCIRSKNYCKMLGGTTYFARSSKTDGDSQNKFYLFVVFYDADKNFIAQTATNNLTFTSPQNAAYFKIHTNTATVIYGSAYLNDICIHLHWDGERDGEYEPYAEHTYPLDGSLTLKGVARLDADNALYFDGDEYAPDGTVTRRAVVVTLNGTESWQAAHSDNPAATDYFRLKVGDNGFVVDGVDFSPELPAVEVSLLNTNVGVNVYNSSTLNGAYIAIRPYSMEGATLEDFKSWLSTNPVTVVYLLSDTAATTEQAEPYQAIQIVDNWGTEEYVDAGVTAGTRDVAIPVGHITKYPQDLRAKLESVPNSPSEDGDYIMRRTSGVNAYAALTKELPAVPTTDGTYKLICTVSDGTATLSWASES